MPSPVVHVKFSYAGKPVVAVEEAEEVIFVGCNFAQAEPHTKVRITGAQKVIFSGRENNLTNCDFEGAEFEYEDCAPPVHVRITPVMEELKVIGSDGSTVFDGAVQVGEISEEVP